MTEISQEAIELVVQAIHDEMPVPLERGPRPNEVRLGVAKALPAIQAQVREELETKRLEKETDFEPGQQREGGLLGEEATLVDHVLQEFAKAGATIVELEGERDQVLAGVKERLEGQIKQVKLAISNEPTSDKWLRGRNKGLQEVVERLELFLATLNPSEGEG